MEHLGHLSTFVSLIYGLGVANVLAHLSSLIKRAKSADWFWVHTIWTVYLLVAMPSWWWVLQNWARMPKIGYFSYLSMLIVPSLLFIMSELLFPERSPTASVDLKSHFFAVKRPFFLAFIGLQAADQLDSALKGWQHVLDLGPFYWGTQAFWYAAVFVGIRSQSVRVQGLLAGVALLLFIGNMLNALAAV